MGRDIEWIERRLKNTVKFEPLNDREIGFKIAMEEVLDLIDQLDEPETLSEEWLDENKSSWTKLKIDGYYIPVDKLQNLLVPKQDVPVVPTWFDEWWKDVTKGGGNLFHNIERFYDELFSSGTSEMYSYIGSPNNKKKLLNIIINELDYVVEEEQKYYVRENNYLLCKWEDEVMDYVEAITRGIEDIVELKLTEKEIKDYNDKYWVFREPVEELEE